METGAAEYLWTADAFNIATDAGVFGQDARLELIQGRILLIPEQGPRHAVLASQIADLLREAVQKQFAIREEKPFRIAFDGEPVPNIMVLNGVQSDYNDRLPGPEDVRLLVEVSNTTAAYDLGGKALLYAQASIKEYWVVLVSENAVIVHRDPTPNGYRSISKLSGKDTLSPLALPSISWTITELLGQTDLPEDK